MRRLAYLTEKTLNVEPQKVLLRMVNALREHHHRKFGPEVRPMIPGHARYLEKKIFGRYGIESALFGASR